jgi:hypothetical protein
MVVTYHVAGIVVALLLGLLIGSILERTINKRTIEIMLINAGLTWFVVTIFGLITQY